MRGPANNLLYFVLLSRFQTTLFHSTLPRMGDFIQERPCPASSPVDHPSLVPGQAGGMWIRVTFPEQRGGGIGGLENERIGIAPHVGHLIFSKIYGEPPCRLDHSGARALLQNSQGVPLIWIMIKIRSTSVGSPLPSLLGPQKHSSVGVGLNWCTYILPLSSPSHLL